jgi:putative tricarboxylic transport membrane protein
MKQWISALVVVPAVLIGVGLPAAHAADWKPEKNVELVIGSRAGGENDRIGRALQRGLTMNKLVDSTMSVVNKPGGGQAVAAAYVQGHPSDPHYLALTSSSWVAGQVRKGNADLLKRYQPILKVLVAYNCFTAKADSTINTMADVKERLSKDAGAVSFAYATGVGNPLHIAIAAVGRAAGVEPLKMKAVVFDAGTKASAQVAGGHLDVGVSSMGSALPLVQGGKLRFIGCGAPTRLGGVMADVPTLKEKGLDVVAAVGYVVHGPAGITAAQIAYWEDALTKALKTPEFLAAVEKNSWIVDRIPSAGLAKYFDDEYKATRSALVDLGLLK